jgi:hypothetical protein
MTEIPLAILACGPVWSDFLYLAAKTFAIPALMAITAMVLPLLLTQFGAGRRPVQRRGFDVLPPRRRP